MLRHIGEDRWPIAIMTALGTVLADGRRRTRDLGGTRARSSSLRRSAAGSPRRRAISRSPSCHRASVVLQRSCPDGIVSVLDGRRDHPGCPVARRYRAIPAGQPPRHAARERIHAYLEELRTTQRYSIYRALKHPLYPILRKIERIGENVHVVKAATRAGRVIYASNHKSHTDYLAEPLVLDDNGIRPPIIAAGINLFGGPLGLFIAT